MSPGPLRRLWEGLRPLDPIRSIKMKFAVLLAVSGALTGLIELYGVTALGWRQRYSLLVAVLISLAISQLIAHGMTAPLRQMTAAAGELARGRSATAVRTTSRDEVGELARAFTTMSRELAAAATQRRELLGNVGHELRTPVAALRAQVENLTDGVRPADEQALTEVLGQVLRLSDLLTDFLELARVDGGAVALDRRPVPVQEFANRIVAEVALARPGRSIDVRVRPPELVVDADPYRLGQVLTNLTDNATRYAREGGRVQVDAQARPGGGLLLHVTDDGPGIAPDRWETVFERFHGGTGEIPVVPAGPRSEGERSASDGGTGLGLAIARWAVMLHDGTIAVVPADFGGCRIRVEIPPQNIHKSDPESPGRST